MRDCESSIIDEDAEPNTNDAKERHQKPEERIRRPDQQIVLRVVNEAFSSIALLRWPVNIFAHQGLSWTSEEEGSPRESNEDGGDGSAQTLVQALREAHEDA